MWQHYFSPAAELDIIEILAWSEEHFGEVGRLRYEKLIVAAIRNLKQDPERHGSLHRDEIIKNARLYHLVNSRKSGIAMDHRVKNHGILSFSGSLRLVN